MKKNAVGLLLAAGCLALMANGCAKQELVKKDESITPPAANTTVKPVENKEVKAPAEKPAPVQETTLNENTEQSLNKEQLQAALEKIYFGFDSSDLSDTARATLAKDSELLQKNSTSKVRIEGNCDERGSAEYNLALGEKRAKAAKKYLETMGIPAANLSTISYGKEKPADPGHDEAAWAKNRRDEFVVQ
jgi:peptidoglycan-associated lipoprotein